jgi:hypothetical protein
MISIDGSFKAVVGEALSELVWIMVPFTPRESKMADLLGVDSSLSASVLL